MHYLPRTRGAGTLEATSRALPRDRDVRNRRGHASHHPARAPRRTGWRMRARCAGAVRRRQAPAWRVTYRALRRHRGHRGAPPWRPARLVYHPLPRRAHGPRGVCERPQGWPPERPLSRRLAGRRHLPQGRARRHVDDERRGRRNGGARVLEGRALDGRCRLVRRMKAPRTMIRRSGTAFTAGAMAGGRVRASANPSTASVTAHAARSRRRASRQVRRDNLASPALFAEPVR